MCVIEKKKLYKIVTASLWMGSLWWKWTSHKCGGGVLDAVCVCGFRYIRALDVCVCYHFIDFTVKRETFVKSLLCMCAFASSSSSYTITRAGPDQFEHPTAPHAIYRTKAPPLLLRIQTTIRIHSLIWIVAVLCAYIQSKCSHHSSHLTRYSLWWWCLRVYKKCYALVNEMD